MPRVQVPLTESRSERGEPTHEASGSSPAEPMVRIHLPPPASLTQQCPPAQPALDPVLSGRKAAGRGAGPLVPPISERARGAAAPCAHGSPQNRQQRGGGSSL